MPTPLPDSSRTGAGVTAALTPQGATLAAEAPKVVKVRAHTRVVKPKTTTPSLPTVRPTVKPSTDVRFKPHYPGEPSAGVKPILEGSPEWRAAAGRPLPGWKARGGGVYVRPFWTDAHTAEKNRGPTGDAASQLNPEELAAAKRAGVEMTAAGEALASVLHPLTDLGRQARGETPLNLGGVVSDLGNVGSYFVPVGKTAALFGGLKGLKGLKGAKKVEEATDIAKTAEVPLPPPTPQEAVRAALPGARAARVETEKGYSVERGKRFAAARQARLENQHLPPTEQVKLAKQQLAGELPKVTLPNFGELNDQSLEEMVRVVLNHPYLQEGQRITASDALIGALAGRTPTHGELDLLEHVFGKDTAAALEGIRNSPHREKILSALNIPRSLMASFDLSAPFRQGLVIATRHPVIFARNFGPMLKAFGSEKTYQAMLDEIHARPSYPLMLEAKVPFTELGRSVGRREEQFGSDYAEKLTGGKYGPVRASGRAFTAFLDRTRADVFDHLIQRAMNQGVDIHDDHLLRSLGRYVGSATGRGDLGHFQEAGKYLNAVFFSPRLLASRLNFLNPRYYASLHPYARKEALRSAIQLAGTLGVLVTLASRIPGVRAATDPRNPDWGKIRIGNTRLDLAGGFQQPLRLLAQLSTGVAISSTTGKKLSLTAGGFGQPTKLDLFLRFFEGKEAPITSFVTDYMRGSNQVGQPFAWDTEVAQRLIPLLAQDSYDLYNEQHGGVNGLLAAFAGYGIGSVGVGVQTYGPRKPKVPSAANSGGSPTGFATPLP